jgi:hypothetical protein
MMQGFWTEIFRIQEQITEHGLGESTLVQAAPPVRNRVKTVQAAYLFFLSELFYPDGHKILIATIAYNMSNDHIIIRVW